MSIISLLLCGDVVGRTGREIICQQIPSLRKEHNLDAVIVNGENAAGGFGINASICRDFFACGVDVITTGNHIWDQRDIIHYIDQEKRLLRPVNWTSGAPGQGSVLFKTVKGYNIAVINVMGRLFMEALGDPFEALEKEVLKYQKIADMIVVDFHAEASSEKLAAAYYFDGRIGALVGTHTHVPTADARILPQGTAYQTDLGMCGDYNSIVGMTRETAIPRFLKKGPVPRLAVAEGAAELWGCIITFDCKIKKALSISSIKRN
jgi:hypothetical protein